MVEAVDKTIPFAATKGIVFEVKGLTVSTMGGVTDAVYRKNIS